MRIETDVIQVKNDPRIINEVNLDAAIWGWSVLNIQITDQKTVREGDSHGRLSAFGDKYVVTTEVITEHTSYATITYQRDLDDPKIQKLAELQLAYEHADTAMLLNDNAQYEMEDLGKILDKQDRDKAIGKYALIGTVISFVLALFGLEIMEIAMWGCLIATVIFYGKAIFTSEYKVARSNYDNHMKNLLASRRNRKEELLTQAKSLHLS